MPDYICSHDSEWRKARLLARRTLEITQCGQYTDRKSSRQAAREQVDREHLPCTVRFVYVWLEVHMLSCGVTGAGRFEQAAPRSWDGAVDCVDQEPPQSIVYGPINYRASRRRQV